MDLDLYDDDLDDSEHFDLFDKDNFEYELDEIGRIEENYFNCILPTAVDTFDNFLKNIIIVNILLKFLILINEELNTKYKKNFKNFFLVFGGLYLIYDFFKDAFFVGLILILFILFGTISIFISNGKSNLIWFFCLFILFQNEFLILIGKTRYKKLRSLIMLFFMKFISLMNYFNLEKNKKTISFLNCLTYMLHPQSLPLGGWNPVKFNQTHHHSMLKNFKKYFLPFILSLTFLICSNCIISHLMIIIEEYFLPYIYFYLPNVIYFVLKSFLNAYFVALQFRFSHYFISFTIQYIHYLWDYDVTITKPFSIEFPRSLVEVVIVWNIPMHEWLKDHLYNNLNFKLNESTSRILTFTLSSLLHGFDFRIWSVLITLSFLTWIEIKLRKKLALKLNSCIESKKCKYEENVPQFWLKEIFSKIFLKNTSTYICKKKHTFTPYNSILVNLINLFFSLLNILHLAFLGSAFDGKEENATIAYVYEIWSYLYFYSFFIFLSTYMFYKLI